MERVIDIAQYFLTKDVERKLFNKELITKNGRSFYEGNARLNKYLHIAQNLYIAKTGEPLFADDLYAYDNGAVAPNVQENYAILYARQNCPPLPEDVSLFLDKVYCLLQNADIEELIEISHEDSAWEEKHGYYSKTKQRMDSLAYAEEYKEQYRDVLRVMEGLNV